MPSPLFFEAYGQARQKRDETVPFLCFMHVLRPSRQVGKSWHKPSTTNTVLLPDIALSQQYVESPFQGTERRTSVNLQICFQL